MKSRYSYKETFESGQKVAWQVEDIIGGEKRLDFRRPFLPESLARVDSTSPVRRRGSQAHPTVQTVRGGIPTRLWFNMQHHWTSRGDCPGRLVAS